MKLSTTLAVAVAAVVITVLVSAALQSHPDVVPDSRILSWFGRQGWW